MSALIALMKKEWQVLRRDIHGLLLLFIMPLIFIVIMSLALQDTYSKRSGPHIHVSVTDQARNARSQILLDHLREGQMFLYESIPGAGSEATEKKRIPIHLQITELPPLPMPRTFQGEPDLQLTVEVEPDTEPYIVTLFTAQLRGAQAAVRVAGIKNTLEQTHADPVLMSLLSSATSISEPVIHYHYQANELIVPTSTQQNVPAWLVFAMFFVVVPLANALITEEKAGTLRRLRTYNVAPLTILLGKLIPYFIINQLQVVLMLMAGVWLLPLLGADRLMLGHSLPALALLSMAVSTAALGYALFIATLARTTDQATTLGGVGNILLAAIGGVMVPVFVMPPFMQHAASFSPMNWAVQGFLDVMLRGGGVHAILYEASLLVCLGLVLMALATFLLQRRSLR